MHDVLRERILRHLDALPEERLYQVLDYIEFLSSKYAREPVRPPSSSLQRFGERLEDRLRANRVGYGAIKGTLEAMSAADRVVGGVADLGRSLLRDMGEAGRAIVAPPPPPPAAGSAPTAPAAPTAPLAPPPPRDAAATPPRAGEIPIDG